MDLLKVVKSESLEFLQQLTKGQDIPHDSQWKDYKALNFALEKKRKDLALYLLQKKCRVNKPIPSGGTGKSTPLHKAVKSGDSELVTALLDKQASIFAVDGDGNSPLHLAFLNEYNKITNTLLDFMVNMSKFENIKNNQGLTHLHIACTTENVKAIEGLIKTKKFVQDEVQDSVLKGYNVWDIAVKYESEKVLKTLKSKTQNLFFRCSDFTRTMIDQKLEDLLLMSDFLSAKKPCIKECPHSGKETVLHKVFYSEHFMDDLAVDKQLTALGQDKKNYIDQNGLSHLHIACTRDRVDLVSQYLDNGADVNAQISYKEQRFYNFTPLHFAVKYEMFGVAKLLIERGADVNASDNSIHGTPLHIALKDKNEDLIDLLLKKGADVRATRPADHATTLHALVEAEYEKPRAPRRQEGGRMLVPSIFEKIGSFFCLLIDRGIDVNAQNSQGDTVLHIVCEKSESNYYRNARESSDDDPFVKKLIESGADVELRNADGETVIEIMCCLTYKKLVREKSNRTKCKYIFDHLENLKALGKNISPETDEYCEKFKERIVFEHYDKFVKKDLIKEQQQRLDEVAKLKNFQLDNSTSLYDFLHMEEKHAAKYIRNNALMTLVEGDNFSQDYPVFDYVIRLQYKKICDYCGIIVDKKPVVLDQDPMDVDSSDYDSDKYKVSED